MSKTSYFFGAHQGAYTPRFAAKFPQITKFGVIVKNTPICFANGENHLKMSICPDSNPKMGASCSDMFTTCCSCHSISRQMSRNVEDTDQPRLQANVEKTVATCVPRATYSTTTV